MTKDEAAAMGLEENTPRLVVMFQRSPTGEEFKWGMTGHIPLLSLLGAIGQVQRELFTEAGAPCPDPCLVIVWDEKTRQTRWYVHPSVPVLAMAGMLTTIELSIASTYLARQHAQQVAILGPDGMPVQR